MFNTKAREERLKRVLKAYFVFGPKYAGVPNFTKTAPTRLNTKFHGQILDGQMDGQQQNMSTILTSWLSTKKRERPVDRQVYYNVSV